MEIGKEKLFNCMFFTIFIASMCAVFARIYFVDNQLFNVSTQVFDVSSEAVFAAKNEAQYPEEIRFQYFGEVFGTPVSTEEMVKQEIVELPETRLQLILKGTFTSTLENNSSAVIGAPNGRTKHIYVGQLITPDSILVQVKKDMVVLRRNGKDEILRLPIYLNPQSNTETFFAKNSSKSDAMIAKNYKASNRALDSNATISNRINTYQSSDSAPVQLASLTTAKLRTPKKRAPRQSLQDRLASIRTDANSL